MLIAQLAKWWCKDRGPSLVAEPDLFFEPVESDGRKPHRFRIDETPPWDYAWCCEDCNLPMHVTMDEKYSDCLTNMMRRP